MKQIAEIVLPEVTDDRFGAVDPLDGRYFDPEIAQPSALGRGIVAGQHCDRQTLSRGVGHFQNDAPSSAADVSSQGHSTRAGVQYVGRGLRGDGIGSQRGDRDSCCICHVLVLLLYR